ncbi:ABC transporter ATP-binding protein [Cryptosporangium arvum]|uniref:ABC-type multidrug transport system, ATPase and permease component n=1 Tax=Cryptosporangium arvum DSM 44712 TaxID=927661 RepID=A0A010ZW93_9ACTN|nr:ABC transporter ATP-binding protein [Cryptosporangium arvum]EXG81487.1 ABC-type multidrug transport system, ATPase and permease component [Cryptosporangium arvum DSM 44712]
MLIRLLRTHLRPYRRSLTVVVVLQFLQTLAMLYLPTLNADIIDYGVVKGDTGYIMRLGGIMLAISVGQIVCAVGAVYVGAKVAMALGRDVRGAVFDRVQAFSAREVGTFGTPSLITRITNDVQQVQMLVVMTLTMVIAAPVMCVGSILLALRQDVPLGSILLVALPVLVAVIGFVIARLGPQFRIMQVKLDDINRVLREQISGIRVIRAFVREPYERKRFAEANDELYDVSLRVGRLLSVMFPSVMVVVNVSSVAVLWFGGHRIDAGEMQIGALTAFLSYLMQTLMSVMMATFMFMMAPRAQVGAERLSEVLDTDTTVVPPSTATPLPEARGRLELRGASFQFPGAEHPILCDVDLVAGPGEVTAIIGSTGAGKTTLLNLIPRLADVTAGAVFVDGVDVRELDPADLSRVIGVVPQRPYLFTGTIASNLRYGNPDATDEQLWHALEIAQAAAFVRGLPEGLDAPIAQGGSNVSGGQRQRLAIARALVHEPEIYLFDDSFSALDYATDAALRAALARETTEATVVIVAQRVSTIRTADRIVVLDQGRVVGSGTHAELLESNDTYREIVLSQLTAQEAAA